MAVTEPAIGSTNWGPVLNAAITQVDTIGPSSGLVTNAAATGAVTINAAAGQSQLLTLTGNVTSSTITNPQPGQKLHIALRQDATGSRTFAWPANVKLAGGSITLTVTAAKTDVVNLFYDGTNWIETGRALNI